MSYTYTTARIRAKEDGLMTNAELVRLVNAPTYDMAVRQLAEKGYKIVNGEPDLASHKRDMWELLSGALPDEVLYVLRLEVDFYNIKTAVKAAYAKRDAKNLLEYGGNIDRDILYESVKNRMYEDLPENIRNVAKGAYETLNKAGDARLMDIKTDIAMLKLRRELAEETGDANLIGYIKLCTDIANLKAAQRCALQNADSGIIRISIADGGELDKESLIRAASDGIDAMAQYLLHTGFSDGSEFLKKSPYAFEKWCDDTLTQYMRQSRYESFSLLPAISYMHAVMTEHRIIRIILSGKRNGTDIEKIRERMRDTYA